MLTPMYRAFKGRAVATAIALTLGSASSAALAQVPVQTVSPVAALSWGEGDAKALLNAVSRSSKEGLDPSNYGYEALKLAIETGDKVGIDYLSTAAAINLATDYRYGRAPQAARIDWHMGGERNPAAMLQFVSEALAANRVDKAIEGLLPNNPEYKALREALADSSDNSQRAQQIKVNMDRWRWMPRSLGQDHVFVNVPGHRVKIVRDGEVVAEHDAIVGKPDTPTPSLMSEATAVALNPSWTVPPVLKEKKLALYQKNPAAARRMGYSLSRTPDGIRITQAPGPKNALGQVKLVMPNEFAIFLHDTSERNLFQGSKRTLSSGCVRVERPIEMVTQLLEGSEWDAARVDQALATGKSAQARLAAPVPVYITYLTARVGEDGSVELLSDPYKRDAVVAAALGATTQVAAAGGRVQMASLR